MKKIGFDIDGVLCDFIRGFYHWFDKPYEDNETWDDPFVFERFHQIIGEEYFWETLKPLINPKIINVPINCYITARPIPSYISYKWLIKNGFPDRPVFSTGVDSQKHNPKIKVIEKLGIDIFIDDKPQHFIEINERSNATCLLMDATWNQKVNAGHLRIKSLSELIKYK